MKTIGIIGGISWLSSAEYYRIINQMVNGQMGGVHSAKIILHSVDYEEIKTLTFAGDWAGISNMICSIAQKLENAGADCILLGANTMHKIAGDIQQAVEIPLLHIAAVTGKEIKKQGLKKVALLGTKYTMELDFYPQQLEKYQVACIIPNEEDRQYIHDAIYNEMGRNIFLSSTKEKICTVINSMANAGAEGVVLGCTEIPLLINHTDCAIPVFDTTRIHAAAAVAFALGT